MGANSRVTYYLKYLEPSYKNTYKVNKKFWITSKFTDGSGELYYIKVKLAADKAADLITSEQAATSSLATDLAAVSLASPSSY